MYIYIYISMYVHMYRYIDIHMFGRVSPAASAVSYAQHLQDEKHFQ